MKWIQKYKKPLVALLTILMVLTLGTVTILGGTKVAPGDPIRTHTEEIKPQSVSMVRDSSKKDKSLSDQEETSTEEKEQNTEQEKPSTEQDNTTEADKTTQPKAVNVKEPEKTVNTDEPGGEDPGEDMPIGDEEEGDPDPKEVSIVTDLKNRDISYSELPDAVFGFYAYLANATPEHEMKIRLKNANTAKNGIYIHGDGRDYKVTLAAGSNTFILYLLKNDEIEMQAGIVVNYEPDKATEDDPNVGENPPQISTSLDGFNGTIKARPYLLTMTAKDHNGNSIPYSNIRITIDGKDFKDVPTGDGTYQYDLFFENKDQTKVEEHKVTVLAWDDEGNSAFKTYKVKYQFVEDGADIGKAYITIDATTLSLGLIKSQYPVPIKQGDTAADALVNGLEAMGYSANYSGTTKSGFYLKSISGSNIAKGEKIPDNLMKKINADGLSMTGQHSTSRISEFDYTQGSGWLYIMNGDLFPGRGLSAYNLSDGDSIILRFTLAYGKDVGMTSTSGALSSYCGVWINGGFKEKHSMGEEETGVKATCTKGGTIVKKCKVKGCDHEEKVRDTDPLGHDYKLTETKANGDKVYTCTRCDDSYTEKGSTTSEKPDDPPGSSEEKPDDPPASSEEKPDPPASSEEKPDPPASSEEKPDDPPAEAGEEANAFMFLLSSIYMKGIL